MIYYYVELEAYNYSDCTDWDFQRRNGELKVVLFKAELITTLDQMVSSMACHNSSLNKEGT